MKSLYKYFVFLIVFVSAQENNFTINGKTNMNTFKYFTAPAQFGSQSSNKIILNIADFDCKYDYITKDFRKTLGADKFPQIHISFGKFKKNNNGTYLSVAEVKLMNKVKPTP